MAQHTKKMVAAFLLSSAFLLATTIAGQDTQVDDLPNPRGSTPAENLTTSVDVRWRDETDLLIFPLTNGSSIEMSKKELGTGEVCISQLKEAIKRGAVLTATDIYCLCYKICPGRNLTETEKKIQQQAIHEMMARYRHAFPANIKAMVAVYICTLLAGLAGNVLVLITVARYLQQASVTNVFICSLSCADLLVLLINIPMKIRQLWVGYWYLGRVMCHVMYYSLYTSFLCSVMTLTAMSIERYLAICHPMKAQYASTPGRARRVVATIWLSSLVLGLPTIFVTNFQADTWVCNLVLTSEIKNQLYTVYLTVIIFMLPSCVMAVAYGHTSVTLWKSVKTSQELQQSFSGNDHKRKSRVDARDRIQVIRMLLGVWIVFVVCWLPYMISLLCDSFGVDILGLHLEAHSVLTRTLTCLAYSNSCLNPFLYGFLSTHFRRGFVTCFRSCCGRPRGLTERMGFSSSTKTRMTGIHKQPDISIAFSKSDLSNSEHSNVSN